MAAFVVQQEREMAEIHAAIAELDNGQSVPHDEVVAWLRSWGSKDKAHIARPGF
ncbi:MAG: hypothetical protein JWN34_4966 [Bryobacterales bacterium]|jgi:predicted transcriptional regulator|nr:hypothetical protein [Bryobacterales bacterium]